MKTKIEVDGVELTVEQTDKSVSISRIVGRDRKRKLDITSSREFTFDSEPVAITLVRRLKQVADLQIHRCTCDYSYGYSDHAEHCTSIHVASEYRSDDD